MPDGRLWQLGGLGRPGGRGLLHTSTTALLQDFGTCVARRSIPWQRLHQPSGGAGAVCRSLVLLVSQGAEEGADSELVVECARMLTWPGEALEGPDAWRSMAPTLASTKRRLHFDLHPLAALFSLHVRLRIMS